MITLHGERMGLRATGTNADVVLTAFDLPAQSVLTGMSCKVDLTPISIAFEREVALGYACAVALIELDDPDTEESYDDLLDRYMPKYTDADVINLDTAAADTSPFWEPGEASFEDVYDMAQQTKVLYRRKRLLTFADPGNRGFRFQPAESPFEPQWTPAESFTIRINKRIRTRKPSCLVVGLASPAFDDTTVTRHAHLGEKEWGQIQYAESTLERALMNQLVIEEAGAETPWVDASLVLRKHLAPNIEEATSASFLTESWNAYVWMQFSHTVPGRMSIKSVDLTP